MALILSGLPFQATLEAQEQHKPRVPVIDKITSGGPMEQMFTGVVKSVSLKEQVLNVDSIDGKSTEIFPIRKKVRVVTADGDRVELVDLKPGADVLVYFEQKGDHRKVKQVVVLTGGTAKKKTPSS